MTTLRAMQLPATTEGTLLPGRITPRKDGELRRAERRVRLTADSPDNCGRRSKIIGAWYAALLLDWARTLPEHGLEFEDWRRNGAR